MPPDPDATYPLCLKGKRACPPEDVGGVWGHEGFLEAIRDPAHEEHDSYLEWVGVTSIQRPSIWQKPTKGYGKSTKWSGGRGGMGEVSPSLTFPLRKHLSLLNPVGYKS